MNLDKLSANMLQEELKNQLKASLLVLKLPEVEFTLDHPEIESQGDYATNVAMVTFPHLQEESKKDYKNPRQLAEAIAKKLNQLLPKTYCLLPVSVAGPGFINISIKTNWFITQLNEVITHSKSFGKSDRLKKQKIMVEFTDPNPFKEFHIGHLYSNIVGESIARLLEANGATVKRACYQGDVGLHVAKSLWGILHFDLKRSNLGQGWTLLKTLTKKPLAERINYLGQAYALGANSYEKDPKAKQAINDLNRQVYEKNPQIETLYQTGRKWSLEYFETIYKRLGTKFDYYYFEREAGDKGLQFIKANLKNGIFEKSQGAVIFPGKKFGLHDRVFINSQGLPTYEAKDLGLAPTKFEDFSYNQSLIVTGNEINEYFKVVLKALSLIDPSLAKKTLHLGHGMVRLPEGKMSSRTGQVLTGEWLLDEAKQAIKAILDKTQADLSAKEKETISEVVGQGAIKYALLKSNIGTDVIFNLKESINFQGNSGPYLQYTFARARSVLSKAKTTAYDLLPTAYDLNSEELAILRWLYRFQEVVIKAGENYAPHLVCSFLYELAGRFNTFYNKHSILQADSPESKQFRLALTATTSQILKNGLNLLGIEAPEKM